jgi:penicillin amidase
VAAIAACALVAGPAGSAAQEGEIVIKRDKFGVPHVFGPDRRAVSYGAGYALAQDRLWQMHVFRHLGKGELSKILGPLTIDIDKDTRFWTYTAAERARRFETWPKQLRADLEAFVAGINAWIDRANADPSKMPFEFTQTGEAPIAPWTIDDSMGLQDFLILTFGAGGGNELQYAALAKRLVEKLGEEKGMLAFNDLVRTVDRDAEPTIPAGLKWRRTPTHARMKAVRSVRRLTKDARLSLTDKTSKPATGAEAPPGDGIGTADQLALVPDAVRAANAVERRLSGLRNLDLRFKFGSNAQIVGPRLAKSRNALQTGGPQVSYAIPQFLADFGMHAPGIDITGMTFAGVGPAVLIGRGKGFAWTTTTGSSDLTDTYVERLNPENRREYLYRDRWEPMECRTERYVAKGVAELEEQEICRTRHGPIASFDEANNVAYSVRYGWMDREIGTTRGFWGFNRARGLKSYATSASMLASNHNMFYTDDRGNFGYWHPGNHPVRAKGVDLRLPQDGTGRSEWRGLLPVQKVPHAVNFKRGWLVNWNNLPARGWPRERAFDARDGVDDLSDPYYRARTPDPRGGGRVRGRKWDFDSLSASLRHAAFADHEFDWYRSALPRAGELKTDLAKRALEVLRGWPGFRVDEDGDGLYDSAGYTLMRAWLPQLRKAAFEDELGEDDLGRARSSTEVWHVFSPRSKHALRTDWLNGKDRRAVAAEAFETAVEQLRAEFESDDPEGWRSKARLEHYTRLNADLFTDAGLGAACGELEAIFTDCEDQQAQDSGWPGDVEDHIEMDRGTYNHVIEYLTRASRVRRLGGSSVRAGSVIPPGQSGFVSQSGEESPHFEDQHDDYVNWTYKPMPLSMAELADQTESTETLAVPDGY